MGPACWTQTQELEGASPTHEEKEMRFTSSTKKAGLVTKVVIIGAWPQKDGPETF